MYKFLIFFSFLMLMSPVFSQTKIPSVTLKNLQGKTKNIQTICESNNLVVISLWATWCVPCIKELDAINDEYDDMKDEVNFKLIAISIDDAKTVKLVKPMTNGKDWDFEVLLDTNNELKRKLGVVSIPAMLIVKSGKIVKKISGYKPGEEDELLHFLKTLNKKE